MLKISVSLVFLIGSSVSLEQGGKQHSVFGNKSTATSYRYDPPQSDPNKKREISNGNSLSITSIDLNTAGYWNYGTPSVTYSSSGSYFRAIEFLEEFDSDGGGDGQLDIQEAIDAVKNYFDNNSQTLPPDGGIITVDFFANILIKRSNSNSN